MDLKWQEFLYKCRNCSYAEIIFLLKIGLEAN